MNHVKTLAQRPFYFALAAATLVAISAPALLMSRVNAAATGAQVSDRSIALSSSKASAGSVTYSVTFTPATTAQELIIDFCGDTPIIEASCTFDANTTPTLTSASTAKAGAVLTHTAHTVKVTGLTMTAGSPYTIAIDNVTNPGNVTSFFARIYTYATGNSVNFVPAASSGGATAAGAYVDYGGIALSTAAVVNITARVMESLSFCVYTGSCGDATALDLGSGLPTKVLGTTPSTGTLKYSLSTNAKSGANINLKGDTLKSGVTNAIAAVNGGLAPGAPISGPGADAFGVKFGTVTTVSGTMTPTANYNGTGGNYALILANTNGASGDTVVTSSAPVDQALGDFTYAARASVTTPAGIYTTTHQLIATGKF